MRFVLAPGEQVRTSGAEHARCAWSELPPSWDESLKLFPWDPCETSDEEEAP